ncbi:MAG: DUF3047 domain-containing protein, partial [Desulfobulbaceae bacterium]|nr:DUF3047 domain-containing protein [Desulfobulbaceae bacterium]
MKHLFTFFLILLVTHANPFDCSAGDLVVARFSEGNLTGWQSKEFSGLTRYDFITLDGKQFLRATSDKSASGLF